MSIRKILKDGLTGEEIGKLFLEDYTDYHFSLMETAKKVVNKELSMKKALNIKTLLSLSEKQALMNSLKEEKYIKDYNNYMKICKYLDDLSIKLAYYEEKFCSECYHFLYVMTKKKLHEKKFNESFSIAEIIESMQRTYYCYIVIKTSILLIEERTGNANIFNSLNISPRKIEEAEFLLNLEIELYIMENDLNLEKKLTIEAPEIPEKIKNEAREKIKDLSFFRNSNLYLHQILAIGGEDE